MIRNESEEIWKKEKRERESEVFVDLLTFSVLRLGGSTLGQ
jgi:hypothetical protein